MAADAAPATAGLSEQVTLASPVGWLQAGLIDGRVNALSIVADAGCGRRRCSPAARKVREALAAYFDAQRPLETVPLAIAGTAFQRRVWDCLQRIPAGQTRSYGDIARELGSGARAVGNACRANPVLLFVPCHRVVAQHAPGGFAGHTQGQWPAIKAWLLAHEARWS